MANVLFDYTFLKGKLIKEKGLQKDFQKIIKLVQNEQYAAALQVLKKVTLPETWGIVHLYYGFIAGFQGDFTTAIKVWTNCLHKLPLGQTFALTKLSAEKSKENMVIGILMQLLVNLIADDGYDKVYTSMPLQGAFQYGEIDDWDFYLIFRLRRKCYNDERYVKVSRISVAGQPPKRFLHYLRSDAVKDADMTRLHSLGQNFKRHGAYDVALSVYYAAAAIQPDDNSAYCNLAKTCYLKGDYFLAIDHYMRTIHLEFNQAYRHGQRFVDHITSTTPANLIIALQSVSPLSLYLLGDTNTHIHLGHAIARVINHPKLSHIESTGYFNFYENALLGKEQVEFDDIRSYLFHVGLFFAATNILDDAMVSVDIINKYVDSRTFDYTPVLGFLNA